MKSYFLHIRLATSQGASIVAAFLKYLIVQQWDKKKVVEIEIERAKKEMPDVNVRYCNLFVIKKWSHMHRAIETLHAREGVLMHNYLNFTSRHEKIIEQIKFNLI